MRTLLFALALSSSLLLSSTSTSCFAQASAVSQPRRVAIIGAGIGGTSAAYFLRTRAADVEIHVFEKTDRVGGRIEAVQLDLSEGETKKKKKKSVELGASIFHAQNRLVRDFAAALELPVTRQFDQNGKLVVDNAKAEQRKKKKDGDDSFDEGVMAIWDGKQVKWRSYAGHPWMNTLSLLWR